MEDVRNEDSNLYGVLFLVRGLPGSGKSTFAKHIWNDYAICEADKYFVNKETGEYNFDPSKLKEAHEWCRNEVEIRMKDHQANPQYYPEIVVSNTFTQEWEMQAYVDLANKYGYRVTTLIIENRHGGSNIHGVPDDKLEIMRNRFEIKL
jgi:predicted kinase